MKIKHILLLGFVGMALTGCLNVEPWEREHLAQPHMALEPSPLDAKFRQHVYFSREATPGGYGADPSGCGCN